MKQLILLLIFPIYCSAQYGSGVIPRYSDPVMPLLPSYPTLPTPVIPDHISERQEAYDYIDAVRNRQHQEELEKAYQTINAYKAQIQQLQQEMVDKDDIDRVVNETEENRYMLEGYINDKIKLVIILLSVIGVLLGVIISLLLLNRKKSADLSV